MSYEDYNEQQTTQVDVPSRESDSINSHSTESMEGQDHNQMYHNITAIPIRFAGFWMRFWAYLLDLIVIGSINRIIINPIFRFFDLSLQDPGIFAPVSIVTAITFYGYFVLMTKFFGQTLGKMVFGLRVVTLAGKPLSWNTVLFREWIGRFISVTLFVSYVIIAFLPKKQGLHDLFVDTSVIHNK